MCHAKVDWSKDRERSSLLPKRHVYLEKGDIYEN